MDNFESKYTDVGAKVQGDKGDKGDKGDEIINSKFKIPAEAATRLQNSKLGSQTRETRGTRENDLTSLFPIPNSQCPIPDLPASSSSASSCAYLAWYLLPIIGFFPSLWTLYRRQGSTEQLATSRISITLAISWLLGYLFLATGAANLDFLSVRLLILNSFLTSGYFLISFWLIIVTIRGKSQRIPGFSRIAQEIFDKYLS